MEFVVVIIFCVTLCSMYENRNKTRVKIAELQAKSSSANHDAASRDLVAIRDELASLRDQVRSLRETTTQYDLSFDTALQRMERRVEQIEQQQQVRLG